MRGVYVLVYLATRLYAAVLAPGECLSLQSSARRRMKPKSIEPPRSRRLEQLERADSGVIASADGVVDKAHMGLDPTSERILNGLGEDDDVILFAPVREFALANGPQSTLMFQLVGDAERAVAFTKWYDKMKVRERAVMVQGLTPLDPSILPTLFLSLITPG